MLKLFAEGPVRHNVTKQTKKKQQQSLETIKNFREKSAKYARQRIWQKCVCALQQNKTKNKYQLPILHVSAFVKTILNVAFQERIPLTLLQLHVVIPIPECIHTNVHPKNISTFCTHKTHEKRRQQQEQQQ